MIKAMKDDSFVELSYDSLRRPVSITYDKDVSLFYTYDNKGRRKTLSDSTGLYKVTYEYESLGHIKSVKRNENQNLMNVKYDEEKVEMREYGDGSKTKYSYSSLRKVISLIVVENKYSELLCMLNYTFDPYGRIIEFKNNNESWEFSYDSTSQMISFKNISYVTEIEYDSVLNRVYERKPDVIHYTYIELNQLKTAGVNEEIFYDGNGNLILIKNVLNKEQRFEFDAENKIKSIINEFINCTYKYDALDNLKSSNCNGVLTEYLIDPLVFLA